MTGILIFAAAWLVLFSFVMCIVVAGVRADEADAQITEMHLPSQNTQNTPNHVSERRGDGEGIGFDHEGTFDR